MLPPEVVWRRKDGLVTVYLHLIDLGIKLSMIIQI